MPRSYIDVDNTHTIVYTVVPFYSRDGDCPWMANTYRDLPVTIDGKTWPTTEHYYQAQKFPDSQAYQDAIRAYGEKGESFRDFPKFARDQSKKLGLTLDTQSWDERSPEVMRVAVRAKITQHPEVVKAGLELLPADVIIVEATKHDRIWGDGDNGKGKNLLGQIWMEERIRLANPGMSDAELKVAAEARYAKFNTYRADVLLGRSLYEESPMSLIAKIDEKIFSLQRKEDDKHDQKRDALIKLKEEFCKNPLASEAEMAKAIKAAKIDYPKATSGLFSHKTKDLFDEVLKYAKRNDQLRAASQAPTPSKTS